MALDGEVRAPMVGDSLPMKQSSFSPRLLRFIIGAVFFAI
jgi:hypothetical protein